MEEHLGIFGKKSTAKSLLLTTTPEGYSDVGILTETGNVAEQPRLQHLDQRQTVVIFIVVVIVVIVIATRPQPPIRGRKQRLVARLGRPRSLDEGTWLLGGVVCGSDPRLFFDEKLPGVLQGFLYFIIPL